MGAEHVELNKGLVSGSMALLVLKLLGTGCLLGLYVLDCAVLLDRSRQRSQWGQLLFSRRHCGSDRGYRPAAAETFNSPICQINVRFFPGAER